LRWISHAYGHYLTHAASGGAVDWRDMVRFHIMKTLTRFDHTPASAGQPGQGGAEEQDAFAREVAVAREIADKEGLTASERLLEWERRTTLSRPTYYRRLRGE
jgi:hypothetical protein